MTRSRDIADQQKNLGGAVAPFVAGKNKIINGDFSQWQRGTSFAGINGGIYTADRWVHGQDGTGSVTYSQQTFTPGTAPVTGYEGTYFLRTTVTATGTASFVQPEQRIEDVRTLAGQTATMSFWAKADSARSNILAVVQVFGSGGSAAVVVATPTINYTTSWQRFTFTFAVPSIAGKTIGSGSNLSIGIRSPLANGSVVDLWGVQLEAGSQATPFTTASGSIGGELALCQRYFQKTNNQSEAPGTAPSATPINATNASSTLVVGIPPFKGVMRVAPTVTLYSSVTGTTGRIRSGGADVVASAADVGEFAIGYISATGLVAGSNSTISFAASAEL